MRLSFEDRTYLVTGGGSGIGKGVAAGLVAAGASVMIVGRNPDRLAAAVQEIEAVKADGGEIRYEPADVTNEDEVTRAVEAATAWHGRLARRGALRRRIADHRPDHPDRFGAWRRTVDLNVNGTMYVLKHCAREMVRGGGGSFVGISSIACQQHPPLVRRLRRHQVGARPPDDVGRRRTRRVLGAGQQHPPGPDPHRHGRPDHRLAGVERGLPDSALRCRGVGEAEDIANMAMFLLSDAAGWVTGQVINVDGGHLLRRGPDFSAMLEPVFGADGLRGVV